MDYLLKLQSKTGKQDLELELKEASVFNFEDILENQSPVSVCADAVYSSVALACSNIEEIAYTEFFYKTHRWEKLLIQMVKLVILVIVLDHFVY